MIKYKRIDSTVIVVLDGRILNRELPEDKKEELFVEILDKISTLNNSILSDDSFMKTKAELINLMIPPTQRAMELEFDDERVKKQAEQIAVKDLEKAKRIADISDQFEYDEKGLVYLKGFSIPLPEKVADALLDAKYNPNSPYTTTSLLNFWQWAVLNPNKQARVDLFSWFKTGEFVITEGGFVVAYRNVNIKQKSVSSDLEDFVNGAFIKVKGQKQSPKNYSVYKDKHNEYICTRSTTKQIEGDFVGILSDLYSNVNTIENSTIYTDNHTGTMTIRIGEEVSMDRELCDENHNSQCSTGLHFMSPKYGLRLGTTTVTVLINPINIVAFPNYDQTKGRCCAYLPIGLTEKDDKGKIIELPSGTYDLEYGKYSSEKLQEIIEGGDLETLKSKGLIAEDLTEADFKLVKIQVKNTIENRIVNVI